MRALPLLLAAPLLLAGCVTDPAPGGTAGGKEGPLTFRDLEGCRGQQATERYVVVQSQAEWEKLWKESCSGVVVDGQPVQPPAVDFTRNSVVAAFWGEKRTGGFAVEVTNITAGKEQVAVRVHRMAAGPTCAVIEAITYPSHVVVSERFEKRAAFTFDDRVHAC